MFSTADNGHPVRSPSYYLESVVFQVEDTLFKVHKAQFTEGSHVFQDMFSIPQPEGSKYEGSDDENPLKLEGVMKLDFENLLKVLFPLYRNKIVMVPDFLEHAKWISVLKLSKMWYFQNVFNQAKNRLNTATSINVGEKVALGREYNISDWLVSGLENLVTRDDPPTKEESLSIGIETTVTVFHLREMRAKDKCADLETQLARYVAHLLPPPKRVPGRTDVRWVFKEEISMLDRGYLDFMQAGSQPVQDVVAPDS